MEEWIIDINGVITKELAESIRQGPILDDTGLRMLTEVTVACIDGLKIQVFSNEHPPPHFRVTHSGESNDYSIRDCKPLHGDGLKKYYRNIREWHRKYKNDLIKAWNNNRPSDCPVGVYRD